MPKNILWKKIWKLRLPSKMKFRMWRMGYESLPLAAKLMKILPSFDPHCVICLHASEDHLHLFRDCPLATATWTHFLPIQDPAFYDNFF